MNPWRGLRGLPREAWVLFLTTLINRSGTMVLPFLVLYLSRARGFSAARAGFTLTVYGIGALVSAPIAGWLCDRIGPRRVMVATLFLSGTILFVFPLARHFNTILVLTFIWAVVSEGFRPAVMTDIADAVPPERRKAAIALIRLAINIGMSIGPAVGGLLATVAFPVIFVVDATTSIVAGIVLAAVLKRDRPDRQAHPPLGAAPAAPALAPRDGRRALLFAYFLLAMLPVEIVFFQHEAAMPLFLVRDLGISEALYGALFTVNTLLIIALEVPITAATTHWPHRRALALGAFLFACGFGALAFTKSYLAVVASVIVWTFGEMVLLPTSGAFVADLAPAAKRGTYMGLYSMGFSVAFAIGPWLGTAVLERFGSTALWGGVFLCGCLSAAMMARLDEPRDRYPSGPSGMAKDATGQA